MGDTKRWYQSKSIWASIMAIVVAVIGLIADIGYMDIDIAIKVIAFLGSISGILGIGGRLTANTKIK